MATIKNTSKVKRVKLSYPSRSQRANGETHREELQYQAAITEMNGHEHAVVLSDGDIITVVNALRNTARMLDAYSASSYESRHMIGLANRLEVSRNERKQQSPIIEQAKETS